MSKKNRTICVLIFLAIFTLAFGYMSIFGISVGIFDVNVASNIKRGLDLTGGVSSVYEAVDTKTENFNDKMDGAVEVFRNRLDSEGYTEATVVRQSDSRIRVEIPINESSKITNPEEVIAFIGKPAKLEFKDPSGNVVVDGSQIESAQSSKVDSTNYVVDFKLNAEGAQNFATATAQNIGKSISIVLDGVTISSPTVQNVISGGSGQITGNFDETSARQLAVQIESGALPLEMKEIEIRSISATLGEEALERGILAGVVGLIAVMIFMIIVYRFQGVLADASLIVYVLLMLFCLATIKGVQLSLPGVAGIILSIGMAVDANIVIFSRINEELRKGKSLDLSIQFGFKKAFISILDSNVTTLIAAGVLFFFGTGTIKGFAITLSIGIVCSMITAVLITKSLLKAMVTLGITKRSLYIKE